MYSALQDKNPMSTNFKVPPGLSSVDIIDFSLSRFVNFQSEITFPEEGGILQVENFGMHINVDGTVLQGMKIEAVMDRRADNISLDLLSRVLVDIQMDSSRIMDDLVTSYQRSLMDMLFMGDTINRTKYNCIMAEGMSPKMSAKVFLGRSEFENEMKQVPVCVCAHSQFLGVQEVRRDNRGAHWVAPGARRRRLVADGGFGDMSCLQMQI